MYQTLGKACRSMVVANMCPIQNDLTYNQKGKILGPVILLFVHLQSYIPLGYTVGRF